MERNALFDYFYYHYKSLINLMSTAVTKSQDFSAEMEGLITMNITDDNPSHHFLIILV